MLSSSRLAAPLSWGLATGASAFAAGLALALLMASASAALLGFGVSGCAELLSALVADLALCLSLLLPAAFLSASGAALFRDRSPERLRERLFLPVALSLSSLSLSLPRALSASRPLCLSFSLLLSLSRSLSEALVRSLSLRSRDLWTTIPPWLIPSAR